MFTCLSKKISFFLFYKKIISFKDIEIYQYGFEMILSTIIGFLITMGIGLVLDMVLLSILYYAVFVFLRQLTGGYHADTYFKCNLTFGIISFLVMIITKLTVGLKQYNLIIHIILIVFSLLTIWNYSPIENKNKPLDETQKKRNHKLSCIFSLSLSFMSCIFLKYNYYISIVIVLTLFAISILMLIPILCESGVRK